MPAELEKKKEKEDKPATPPPLPETWRRCPVRGWNTSCGGEKICMFPDDPKCPTNSGATEIINN